MTVCCLIIIGCSAGMSISTGVVGNAVGHVIVPMQKGLNQLASFLHIQKEDFATKQELQEENEELKEEIAELEEKLNRVSVDTHELEEYQELYDMEELYYEYDTTAANVVSNDSGNWFSTFLIDKGSDDGIEVGNNVLADGGLVGIVTDVGSNYAKVRSIIDDNSNVSAMDLNTEEYCIVSGSLSTMNERQQLEITDLQDDDDLVQAGDQIVTSAISDRYLPNIPIGYVVELEEDSDSLTKTGYIATIVDFEHLEKVLVIDAVKDYSDAE